MTDNTKQIANRPGRAVTTQNEPNPVNWKSYSEKLERDIAEMKVNYTALEKYQPYVQTEMELCGHCGWKTRIPGDVCLNCEHEKRELQEPWAWFHPDGRRFLGHGTKQCNRGDWVDEYCIPVYTKSPHNDSQSPQKANAGFFKSLMNHFFK